VVAEAAFTVAGSSAAPKPARSAHAAGAARPRTALLARSVKRKRLTRRRPRRAVLRTGFQTRISGWNHVVGSSAFAEAQRVAPQQRLKLADWVIRVNSHHSA
jgi:hypothetical protein